ncbi:MAG: hypothetical protein AB1894_03025 [Chloroflexota bacterium]
MQRVEIRVKGHLDESWAEWLEGLSLTHVGQEETILSGQVSDQAATYGLIAKLRDLGARLILVDIREIQDR